MSFIYPRTITITRPTRTGGKGFTGYSGQNIEPDAPVASNIQASIQESNASGKNPAGLPGDSKQSNWRIFFRAANGLVQEHDIITDDLNVRYQVVTPYWNSLGYNCGCDQLDT